MEFRSQMSNTLKKSLLGSLIIKEYKFMNQKESIINTNN